MKLSLWKNISTNNMDGFLYQWMVILAVVVLQVSTHRYCPPGELQHEINETVRCCKPKYHCPENQHVSVCRENQTQEICKTCPVGTTLSFTSSSFNRKQCYAIPSCKQQSEPGPAVIAVSSSNCTCNWTNGLYAKETLSMVIPFDCQFRSKCRVGEEPTLFADGCSPCKYGFYQSHPATDGYFPLCKAWTNCSLLGLEEQSSGTRTQNAVCREGIHTSPGHPTDDKSTATVVPVTDINSTTQSPKTPSKVWKTSIWVYIAAVAMAMAFVTAAFCMWWFFCRTHGHATGQRDVELCENLVNETSNSEGNSTNNPPTTTEQTMMKTVIDGRMKNGQVQSDWTSNGILDSADHIECTRPKQTGSSVSQSEGCMDNCSKDSLQPEGVSDISGPDKSDQTLRKPIYMDVKNPSTGDPSLNGVEGKDTPSVAMNPVYVSDLSHFLGDPSGQTVRKQYTNTSCGGNNALRDLSESDHKVPHEENKTPRKVTGRPLLKTQSSYVSGLPSSPITPDPSKPHAFVPPLPVENSDNSSSVVDAPNSSSSFSGGRNLSTLTSQQALQSANLDSGAVSGDQSSVSFYPPDLHGNGSLSDTVSRQNEGSDDGLNI